MTSKPNEHLLYEELHAGVLLFQRKMRWVRTLISFPLGLQENLVLSFLAQDPTLTAKDLSKLLNLTKSTVSRLLATMRDKGYLFAESAADDRRARQLAFTAQGLQLLRSLNPINEEIALRGTEALSGEERRRLTEFLRALNDGLGAAFQSPLPGIEPMVIEQRRLSRQTGMLGKDYMGTGLDVMTFQLLFEIDRNGSDVPLSHLKTVAPFHPSRLSRLIDQFATDGLLEKRFKDADRRTYSASLTAEGEAVFRKWKTRIAKEYASALPGLTRDAAREFIRLLRKVGESPLPKFKSDAVQFHLCRSETERRQARAFLVEELVKSGRHRELGETLLPESGVCCIATVNDRPAGVVEVLPKKTKSFLSYAVMSERLGPEGQRRNVLLSALRYLAERTKWRTLEVSKIHPEFEMLREHYGDTETAAGLGIAIGAILHS